jgi:hypothetical protein
MSWSFRAFGESAARALRSLALLNEGAEGGFVTMGVWSVPRADAQSAVSNLTAIPLICLGPDAFQRSGTINALQPADSGAASPFRFSRRDT